MAEKIKITDLPDAGNEGWFDDETISGEIDLSPPGSLEEQIEINKKLYSNEDMEASDIGFEENPDWLDLDEWIPDNYADLTRLIVNSVGGGLAELAMYPLYTGKAAWDFGSTEGNLWDRLSAAGNTFLSIPEFEQIFKNKIGGYTPDNLERYENAEYWGRLGSMFVPGAGIINAAGRIPKIGNFLRQAAPMTMMGTKGLSKILERSKWAPFREIAKDVGKSSWNTIQNLVGIGGAGYLENKYDIADKVGEFMQNPADAAGQMPTSVRAPSNRAMMEMANMRGSPQEGWGMTVEFPDADYRSDRYALD